MAAKFMNTHVFAGQVQSCLQRSLDSVRQQGQGLRIRLRLSDAPELTDLPWEFLYDPTQSHFLAYSTLTPLARYLDLPNTVLNNQIPTTEGTDHHEFYHLPTGRIARRERRVLWSSSRPDTQH